MSAALPSDPNLEWLRKTAKQQLREIRVRSPGAKLADAQLSLARHFGFMSWRSLKAYIEQLESRESSATATSDLTVAEFLRAVGSGRLRAVRSRLEAEPKLVNAVGPHPFWGGRPQALHVSIETKRRDMFDTLLEAGANVDGSNEHYDHCSPLMLSITWHRLDMQEKLLERGAKIGLVEALLMGDDARVEKMLRRGQAALPSYAPNGGSILAMARTPFAIDRLLDLGVPRDVKDRWDTTPIEAMSRLGASGQPLVRHLIEKGLKASPQEYARLGDRKHLAALIRANPEIAASPEVMMGAVDFRHHELAEWLLAHGASANARSTFGSKGTALHSAAWNGDLRMVKLLVAAGADANALDMEHNNTPAGFARVATEVTNNPECAEVEKYLRGLS